MTMYKVPVIGGDGVGPEVIEEGKKVLRAAAEVYDFDIEWLDYPHGANYYLETGELIQEDTLRELKKYKAIYLGAVGDERVKPGVLEKGILLAIRFYFDQYINIRPIRLLEGIWTPLKNKGPKEINFKVVRENTEDFYIGIGGRARKGLSNYELDIIRELYSVKFGLDIDSDSDEIAYQVGMISKEGTERVIRYSFELAQSSKKHVSSADKANVISMYEFWREVLESVAADYPDVKVDFNYVDAMAMWFVKNPEWFDIVVTPNMFGDILTDLGAMIQGGMGFAPGGNINPQGTSMFEPIHGSAPKYAGKSRANPIATIWAGAMLLDHLGEKEASNTIVGAIEQSISKCNVKTYDMGGSFKTSDVGDEIARIILEAPVG
ncbi:MAG: isocitrate/isopropylmalate dehydrogenase family protein [Methanocellales archaeon]|nr:isocitrate/isopropylmalate dehydrogenase family protein [Methanocellales archaeon]